uniref:Uncharacterized protein n=1 Tax=Anas platyrhynchos platyrhynchos TaxID=8840 RepID=A0A493TG85_ANAPP
MLNCKLETPWLVGLDKDSQNGLDWKGDIPPKNGSEVFFSHEIYEKYSLAPSLSELWNLSNREKFKPSA